jgi:hypothetical protein
MTNLDEARERFRSRFSKETPVARSAIDLIAMHEIVRR